jgi:hypothetical protein
MLCAHCNREVSEMYYQDNDGLHPFLIHDGRGSIWCDLKKETTAERVFTNG